MSIFYKVYTLPRKYKVTDGQSIFYINPRVADVNSTIRTLYMLKLSRLKKKMLFENRFYWCSLLDKNYYCAWCPSFKICFYGWSPLKKPGVIGWVRIFTGITLIVYTRKNNYAPIEKGGILFCNCRSVCRPSVVRSISFDRFTWSIPNLVQGLPSMSRWSLLIFRSHV